MGVQANNIMAGCGVDVRWCEKHMSTAFDGVVGVSSPASSPIINSVDNSGQFGLSTSYGSIGPQFGLAPSYGAIGSNAGSHLNSVGLGSNQGLNSIGSNFGSQFGGVGLGLTQGFGSIGSNTGSQSKRSASPQQSGLSLVDGLNSAAGWGAGTYLGVTPAIDNLVKGGSTKSRKATYSFDDSLAAAAVDKAMAALGWTSGFSQPVNVDPPVSVPVTLASAPTVTSAPLLGASTPLDVPAAPTVPNPEPATLLYLVTGTGLLLGARRVRRATT